MMGAKQNPGGANPIINKKYFFFLVLQPEIFFYKLKQSKGRFLSIK